MSSAQPVGGSHVLSSWKDIAAHFRRGVRTVQRWEAHLGLPIHRPDHADRRIVLAYPEELDRWARGGGAQPSRKKKQRLADFKSRRETLMRRAQRTVQAAQVLEQRCEALQKTINKLAASAKPRHARPGNGSGA